MNWALSGEPAPSMARSISSAASSASSMPCASIARLMARLVCLTSSGSMAAMWRASRSAVSSSSAAGTTRLIMPISRARAALSRSSPVRMISLATLGPTIHGRIITTMPAPNFSSGSPKKASSAAIVRSQASASSQAPARQGPRTAAIVGFGQCQKRITVSKSLRRIGCHCSTPVGRRSICSFRSKPEENAAPAPRTMMARTSGARSASSRAWPISSSMAWFSALARSGRLSVMRATPSRISSTMVENGTLRSPSAATGAACSANGAERAAFGGIQYQ